MGEIPLAKLEMKLQDLRTTKGYSPYINKDDVENISARLSRTPRIERLADRITQIGV
jgi:hypothetical protein